MLIPLGHTILVKPDEIETKTKSGIVLVIDEKLEKAGQMLGTLVAIGDQAYKAFSSDFTGEPWALPGDRVLFSRYAGKNVVDPETGENYLIMNDDDLKLKIVGEKIDG